MRVERVHVQLADEVEERIALLVGQEVVLVDGDAALIHLATVTRETMRPQDTVARFGGEEFIILLPDTSLPDAQKAMIRLQRELTRRIFLHENEKVLITFSAGVTDFRPDDNQATVTRRADEAMYQAKKTGKNRVVIG